MPCFGGPGPVSEEVATATAVLQLGYAGVFSLCGGLQQCSRRQIKQLLVVLTAP